MGETALFTELLLKIVDNRGRTCPTASNGTPLIATNCVKNGTLYPTYENVRYVDEETMSDWFRGHPMPGDILFVCKGSPGQVCLVPDPIDFCIAQDMVSVRADPRKIYPPYLFAALRSSVVQNQIANMHVGTMIPHFKKGDFDKLHIPMPDIQSQMSIGDLYLELSNKIELNRRINETLEASARALFRDWFVDFGPVKAKAAAQAALGGPAQNHQAKAVPVTPNPATFAPEIWSLFPDALDDEGKPEGWQEFRLDELADYRTGSINPGNQPDTLFEHYSLPAYDAREQPALDLGSTIKSNKTQIPSGAILLSKLNPETPRVWIPDLPAARPQVASTEFLAFVPKKKVGMALVYSLFNETTFRQTLAGMVTGTSKSHQRVSPGAVTKLIVLTADPQIFSTFEKVVGPMLDQILANRLQSRTLAQTRDMLLPKLMSGEIRVADGARAVDDAL